VTGNPCCITTCRWFSSFQRSKFLKKRVRVPTEVECPACKGTGFAAVEQPTKPGRKIYLHPAANVWARTAGAPAKGVAPSYGINALSAPAHFARILFRMICADVNRAPIFARLIPTDAPGFARSFGYPCMIFASLTLAVIGGIFPPFPALVSNGEVVQFIPKSGSTRKQPV